MLMNIVDTFYTEDFGKIDVEPLEPLNNFSLMIKNPYVRLEKWFNVSRLRIVCKEIIAPRYCPFTRDETPVYKFCMENKIPFKGISLKDNITNKYVMLNNYVFVNLSKANEYPKLLLVYIPDGKTNIIFNKDDAIIGLSTNTVDLEKINSIHMHGDLYGSFRYDFSKVCSIKNGVISYSKLMNVNNDFMQIPYRDLSVV